ncbi:fluoride efflux transporter CrcB [Salipaludibacillus sp. CF4.18]|uniref:fluoride efflux transporter CrcB n=1 Tax=Salipaludibacillus sp. CF4.18 TaxID=3373081 RepID=UPI003EE76B43
MVMNILLVALGGGLGASCRYLLGAWVKSHLKQRSIPTAMLMVNILGSLFLGLFFGGVYQEVPQIVYDDLPFLVFAVGFCGAFTTFSTFSVEAVTLLQKQKKREFITYVSLSIGGAMIAFLIGMFLGSQVMKFI